MTKKKYFKKRKGRKDKDRKRKKKQNVLKQIKIARGLYKIKIKSQNFFFFVEKFLWESGFSIVGSHDFFREAKIRFFGRHFENVKIFIFFSGIWL